MKRKTAPAKIVNSILELSKEKSIDKISIKEIVDHCGLSSQTFYNHFKDKNDLILQIYNAFGDDLMERYDRGEISFREMMIENLRFYADHSGFMLNAMANTYGAESFRLQSSEIAIKALEKHIMKKQGVEKLLEQELFHIRMFAYANTEIYAYWAETGMQQSPDLLADYILTAIPTTIKKFLLD